MRTSRLSSALAMVGVLVAGGVAIADDDPTTASSGATDVVIIVLADDPDPRTISTSFNNASVPTITIEPDGAGRLELIGELGGNPWTSDVLDTSDFTQGNAELFSVIQDQFSNALASISWTNPEGQGAAKVEIQRLPDDGSSDGPDLEPFRVCLFYDGANCTGQSDAQGNPIDLWWSGTESGTKLATDGLAPNTASTSKMRIALSYASGKGPDDLGGERTITTKFVFSIMDDD